MRVISGKARGIRLQTIEGLNTRPTTDRIKESIFNLIQFHVRDAYVLDLYSGSGALGIEAASRGAEKVFLVENNRDCHKVINENIKSTKLNDVVDLITSDVMSGMRRITNKIDIVIMDPPYGKDLVIPTINAIEEYEILNEEGIILVEHSLTDILPETIGLFKQIKQKKYGKILISIYSYDN